MKKFLWPSLSKLEICSFSRVLWILLIFLGTNFQNVMLIENNFSENVFKMWKKLLSILKIIDPSFFQLTLISLKRFSLWENPIYLPKFSISCQANVNDGSNWLFMSFLKLLMVKENFWGVFYWRANRCAPKENSK